MKIETNNTAERAFTPVSITITIESEEELRALFTATTAAYANLNETDVRSRRAESISSELRDIVFDLSHDRGVDLL